MFKNSVMMNLKDLNDEIFKSISTIYKNLDNPLNSVPNKEWYP